MLFIGFVVSLFLSIGVPVFLISQGLSAEIMAAVSLGALIFFTINGGLLFNQIIERLFELNAEITNLQMKLERVQDMAEMHENTLTENLIFPKD